MSYARIEDVTDFLARTRFQPSDSSEPTLQRILARAATNSAELDAILGSLVYEIPVDGTAAYQYLVEMNALYTAWWLHYYLWNLQARTDKCAVADELLKEYERKLELLVSGKLRSLFTPDADAGATSNSLLVVVYPDTERLVDIQKVF